MFEASVRALLEGQASQDEVLVWIVDFFFFEEMEGSFLEGAWGLLNAVGVVDIDAEEQVVRFSLGEAVSDVEIRAAVRGLHGGVVTGKIEGTGRQRTNREGGTWRCCIIL